MGKRKSKDRLSAEALQRRKVSEAAKRKKQADDNLAKTPPNDENHESLPANTTSHTWKTQGKLGLVLQQRGDSPEDCDGVCVSSITDPALREKLRVKGIAPGRFDFLLKVAGVPTATKSYTEVINLVKSATRPLTITFGEDADEESDEGQEIEYVPNLVLSGCGNAEVNGTYCMDGIRDEVPSFRKVDGDLTIERDAAPGQLTQWCICRNYGFESLCYVDSEASSPPSDGWAVADGVCEGPPPIITTSNVDAEREA